MANTTGSSLSSGHNLAAAIGRNTFFGVVARMTQVATRLVTVPVVIAHLGIGGYGIWAIIMTAAAYMRFGSIGVKSAFQKYVAEATGKGEYETTNQLLSTGCAAMFMLSLIGLIPVALFARRAAQAAGVPPEFVQSTAHSLAMLAIIMVLSNVGAVFEAIVMGGHRVDLARNLTTFCTIAEAVVIIVLLQFGIGLFGLATVMAASEVAFISGCYFLSKKVVPQVRVAVEDITLRAVGELARFAGSYQLFSILEVVYLSIVPIAVLRLFGANSAGIFALTTRLAQSALMLPDALIVPILSGGAMVFASGLGAEMRALIGKSFKVTLALGLFPLALLAAFGPLIVLAWTGETAPMLRGVFCLVCAGSLFQAFSRLCLVLYRCSGRALLDNIRQGLQIGVLLLIMVCARRLGFNGVLVALAAAELFGMLFMMFALTKAFATFRVKELLPDAIRLVVAIAMIVAVGGAALLIPIPATAGARSAALLQLAMVLCSCLMAMWPAVLLTKSLTSAESRAVVQVFARGKRWTPSQSMGVESCDAGE